MAMNRNTENACPEVSQHDVGWQIGRRCQEHVQKSADYCLLMRCQRVQLRRRADKMLSE